MPFICDNQECLCNRCRHRRWAESGWCMCNMDPAEGECRPDKQCAAVAEASKCSWGFDEGRNRMTLVLCEHQREAFEEQASATNGPESLYVDSPCPTCQHMAGTVG